MENGKTEVTYWRSAKVPTVQYGSRDICLTIKSVAEPGKEDEEYQRIKLFVDERVEAQAKMVSNDTSRLRIRVKDGKKYPSITSIMNPDPIPVPNIEKYALRGTEYHKGFNEMLFGKPWSPDNTVDISPLKWEFDLSKFFEKFGDDIKPAKLNEEVFNEKYLYSGEIDFIGTYKDMICLADFKTGLWKLEQLAAYAKCAQKLGDCFAIFDLKKMDIIVWDIKDEKVRDAWEKFLILRGRLQERFGV